MAHILTLPDEILVDIGEYLTTSQLFALCHVSKRFNKVMTKLLYRVIRLHWAKDSDRQPAIALLLRSLIQSPSLSWHIETLEISGQKQYESWKEMKFYRKVFKPSGPSRSSWLDTPGTRAPFSDAERKIGFDLIKSFSLDSDDEKDWINEFSRGDVDVILVLILSKCQELKSLSVGADFNRTQFFATFMRSCARQNRFSKLKYASINFDIRSMDGMCQHAQDPDCVLALFTLPALENLCLSLPARSLSWPGITPISQIRFLVLRRSQVSEEDLGTLLRATPYLKSLEYDSWFDMESNGRPRRNQNDSFDCERFDQSLIHVCDCLERLVLGVDFFSFDGELGLGDFRGAKCPMRCLKEMKKLTTLHIPYIILLGWALYEVDLTNIQNTLPPMLRELTLTDDLDQFAGDWSNATIIPAISNIVPHIAVDKSRTDPSPKLSIFRKHTGSNWNNFNPQMRSELETCCGQAGILFHAPEVYEEPPEILRRTTPRGIVPRRTIPRARGTPR